MLRHARYIVTLLSALLLAGGPLLAPQTASAAIAPPRQLPPTGVAALDAVWYGEVPADAGGRPVLVFVHGYGGTASDWWSATRQYPAEATMYSFAYNAGYRTAFVSLALTPDGRTPVADPFVNGQTLSQQLVRIAEVYGVDRLVVVAHSKGGVDTQAALSYFPPTVSGRALTVEHVFTLGTPHGGTQLADLCYTFFISFLCSAIGSKDAGSYSMQTGYMRTFRVMTDGLQGSVPYHLGAGTDWGSPTAGLRFSGRYLSRFGPNDGVVPVGSATGLPAAYASTLFVQPWDHYRLALGNTAFSYVQQTLAGAGAPVSPAAPLAPSAETSRLPRLDLLRRALASAPPPASSAEGLIVRTGRLAGALAQETLPIEPGARRATFDILVSDPAAQVSLRGPDGRERALTYQPSARGSAGPLAGAARYTFGSAQPAGLWRLQVAGAAGATYLALADVESPLAVELRGLPAEPVAPGQPLAVSPAVAGLRARGLTARVEVSRSAVGREPELVASGELDEALSWTPAAEGLYVVLATVRGETAGGRPFERGIVRSLTVLEGEPSPARLMSLGR